MKIRIIAALVAMFLALGISNQVSAHPWHRGGWYGPRFGVRVVVPAPVVVGGYYDAYPPAPAPAYYSPAPVVVGGGYGGYGYYGHREGWNRGCREGYRGGYYGARGGNYGPRGGYGRGYRR